MKKHPVDDLFKRRLSELEKRPSNAAWEKIQAKTKKERRLAGWVWYAAASVAITLVAVYIVWNSERSNIETIGKQKKISVVLPPTEASKDLKTDSVQDVRVEVKELPASNVEVASNVEKRQLKSANHAKQEISDKINVVNQKVEPEKLAANDIEIKEEHIAELPIIEKVTPKSEEVLPAKIAPTPVEPTRMIVVAVVTNDQDEEKPKSSRFSKVFRQLKNARAGERVDWEEVGFNPKSLVAKVDDRLRNGEEKVSEKYQNLKEKTKL